MLGEENDFPFIGADRSVGVGEVECFGEQFLSDRANWLVTMQQGDDTRRDDTTTFSTLLSRISLIVCRRKNIGYQYSQVTHETMLDLSGVQLANGQ